MIISLLILIATSAECDKAITQTEMTICAGQEYERADADLNKQWKITLADARRMDRESATYGYRPPGYAEALLRSQRAWITYRAEQCLVEGQQMRGGSGEPMLVNQCLARMAHDRTAVLPKMIGKN